MKSMSYQTARSIVEILVEPFNRDFFAFVESYNSNKDLYTQLERQAVERFEQYHFNPAE